MGLLRKIIKGQFYHLPGSVMANHETTLRYVKERLKNGSTEQELGDEIVVYLGEWERYNLNQIDLKKS